MRAVVAHQGRVSLADIDEPVPGPGQILVEPVASGICGSDLHLLETQSLTPDAFPPVVLGHEFVARVLDWGPATDRGITPGTLVTSMPWLDTAAGPQLVGLSPVATGGLAERMVLQEHRLLTVAADVEPNHVALAEPIAVGVRAVSAARMGRDDVALVIGCGPIGLAVVAALKASGHGPVVATDFSEQRRRLAETMGADVVVDAATDLSAYTTWAALAGDSPPPSPLWGSNLEPNTVAFECVGAPGLLQRMMEAVPPHTRIVVAGVCQQPDSITPLTAVMKELSVRYIFAYRPKEFRQALEWIVDKTIDVSPMITAQLGLADAERAFDELSPPSRHCKILLSPNRP